MISAGSIGMPLHFGKVPSFLTERMGDMGEAIIESIVENYQPDRAGRGRQLRRLHRAGPHHADGADPVVVERILRHLFPEIHRYHLRTSVSAGLVP